MNENRGMGCSDCHHQYEGARPIALQGSALAEWEETIGERKPTLYHRVLMIGSFEITIYQQAKADPIDLNFPCL